MVEGAITIIQFGTGATGYASWLSNNIEINKILYHPWYIGIQNTPLNVSDFHSNTSNMAKDKRISLTMDATMAFLYSKDALIKDKCQNINRNQIKNCIANNNLKDYLNNVSFIGMSGKIKFGAYRSANNPLKIGNFLKLNSRYRIVAVGKHIFSTQNGSQLKLITKFRWRNYTYYNSLTAPSSRCSDPCKIDEYQTITSSLCC
ncbi:unnamed protein product [Gordionus sp. m RMFG-2023]